MTLRGLDLIALAALMLCGIVAGCYALLLRRLRRIVAEREMKVADQIGALNDAIRALETRLTEHQRTRVLEQVPEAERLGADAETGAVRADEDDGEETSEIDPEIQAVIAAAAVAELGQGAVVHSVKSVPSPWSQQGRVLVQGGHNLRVKR